MTKTSDIKHAYFCKPRPDESEARIETFEQDRFAADGISVAGHVTTVRCVECGVATYDGVPEDQLGGRPATNYVLQPSSV